MEDLHDDEGNCGENPQNPERFRENDENDATRSKGHRY